MILKYKYYNMSNYLVYPTHTLCNMKNNNTCKQFSECYHTVTLFHFRCSVVYCHTLGKLDARDNHVP